MLGPPSEMWYAHMRHANEANGQLEWREDNRNRKQHSTNKNTSALASQRDEKHTSTEAVRKGTAPQFVSTRTTTTLSGGVPFCVDSVYAPNWFICMRNDEDV